MATPEKKYCVLAGSSKQNRRSMWNEIFKRILKETINIVAVLGHRK
jgi:hypothetical protein